LKKHHLDSHGGYLFIHIQVCSSFPDGLLFLASLSNRMIILSRTHSQVNFSCIEDLAAGYSLSHS